MEFYAALMRAFGISVAEMEWNEGGDSDSDDDDGLPFKINDKHFENNYNGTEDDVDIDDDEAREFSKATLDWWNEYVFCCFFFICLTSR
jgi:hypothetical protein